MHSEISPVDLPTSVLVADSIDAFVDQMEVSRTIRLRQLDNFLYFSKLADEDDYSEDAQYVISVAFRCIDEMEASRVFNDVRQYLYRMMNDKRGGDSEWN